MEKQQFYEQTGVAMTCRSFAEYVSMFALEERPLSRAMVLDAAGGASSFTAEMNSRGGNAYAADPLYAMSSEEIAAHGKREIERGEAQITRRAEQYCWDFYGDPAARRIVREQSLLRFLDDYSRKESSGRYFARSLPDLGFAQDLFDLVLCSHFLFLYAGQFGYEFHLAAVLELLRVCRKGGEVRIYPLLAFDGTEYAHLRELLEQLEERGVRAEFLPTRLPFIPGSRNMLRLVK